MSKLDVLAIEPESGARSRVNYALSDAGTFGTVEMAASLDDSWKKIALGAFYDVIFVSQRLKDREVMSFVRKCKETRAGRYSTYIMILNSNENSEASIRLKHALGLDAFLLEPYSSEQLEEVVDFSFETRTSREEVRNRVAISLSVIDIMDQLNLVAFLTKCRFSTRRSWQRLKEMCEPLREMTRTGEEVYFDLIEHIFPEAPFPKHFKPDEYHRGVTERVREKMERRILRDLQELRAQGRSPMKQFRRQIENEHASRPVRVISK